MSSSQILLLLIALTLINVVVTELVSSMDISDCIPVTVVSLLQPTQTITDTPTDCTLVQPTDTVTVTPFECIPAITTTTELSPTTVTVTTVSTTTVSVSIQSTVTNIAGHIDTNSSIIGGLLAFIVVLITIVSIIAVIVSYTYGKSLGKRQSYRPNLPIPTIQMTNVVALEQEASHSPPTYDSLAENPDSEPEYTDMASITGTSSTLHPPPPPLPARTGTGPYANLQHNPMPQHASDKLPPIIPRSDTTASKYSKLNLPSPPSSDVPHPVTSRTNSHLDSSAVERPYDLTTPLPLPTDSTLTKDLPIITDDILEGEELYEEL